MQSRMSLKKLWQGDFVSGSIHLSEPASAYDALRFVHLEDYSNQGSYKCSDVPYNYSQGYSIYLPFYEGNWYIRNACMVPINDYNDISARSRQQILIPSGATAMTQSWSGENSVANIHVNEIYGIKYQDEDEYDPSKIYYDRTLLFSQDNSNNSGMTTFNVSEDLRRFNFVEWEMNNPMANLVSPGSAKYVTPFFMLQSDTNWYLRATQWSATNNYTSYLGRQYMQDVVTVSSNNTIGNIPAPYMRNLNPMKVYGVSRRKQSKLTILPSEHGTASASKMSGYPGLDTSTLYGIPYQDWYLSGYNISGATLSGNQFMFGDEDVTVQPLFTDQEKRTITIVQPTGGTISASVLEGFDGTVVTLSNTPATGYQFQSYSVSGATLSGNSFMINGSDVTVTGTFKDVSLTIDLNNVGKEVTTEFRNQTKYPNNWTDYRVFTCGKGPNGDYTNYIKNLGNLSSNFTLLWLPDTHTGTSYSYGRGNYTTDNTQAFYNTCPYGSGLDNSYPRYQRSRYYSTTINVSKKGNLKMFLHATSWWYTNILYFAIPKNLVRSVINSA